MSLETSYSTNGQLLLVLVLYILLNILEMETPPETVGISHLHSLVEMCHPFFVSLAGLWSYLPGINTYQLIDFLYVSEDAF